jgi:hypothetical protein
VDILKFAYSIAGRTQDKEDQGYIRGHLPLLIASHSWPAICQTDGGRSETYGIQELSQIALPSHLGVCQASTYPYTATQPVRQGVLRLHTM